MLQWNSKYTPLVVAILVVLASVSGNLRWALSNFTW